MRALGLALTLLLAAGCFGGSNAASRPLGSQSVSPAIPMKLDWRITYRVGFPQSHRSALLGCPDGATCRVFRDPGVTSLSGTHLWAETAVRHVLCAPSGEQSGQSCQAIARLRAILAKPDRAVCSCPGEISPAGEAVTRIDG